MTLDQIGAELLVIRAHAVVVLRQFVAAAIAGGTSGVQPSSFSISSGNFAGLRGFQNHGRRTAERFSFAASPGNPPRHRAVRFEQQ